MSYLAGLLEEPKDAKALEIPRTTSSSLGGFFFCFTTAFAAISFAWRWGRLGSLGDAEEVEGRGDGGGDGVGGRSGTDSVGRPSTSGGRTSPPGTA